MHGADVWIRRHHAIAGLNRDRVRSWRARLAEMARRAARHAAELGLRVDPQSTDPPA